MSRLEKFDGTLNELDTELGKLKSVTEAYQKIQSLADSNAEVNHKFDLARQELGKINDAHLANKAELDKCLSDLLKSTEEGKSAFERVLDSKIAELREENKRFYRDLEDTVRIKLDDNKREIKSLIESERLQMKEIIVNELGSRTLALRDAIEAESERHAKLLLDSEKRTRVVFIILGVTSVALEIWILSKILNG
jgi:hypothetical protein